METEDKKKEENGYKEEIKHTRGRRSSFCFDKIPKPVQWIDEYLERNKINTIILSSTLTIKKLLQPLNEIFLRLFEGSEKEAMLPTIVIDSWEVLRELRGGIKNFKVMPKEDEFRSYELQGATKRRSGLLISMKDISEKGFGGVLTLSQKNL